VNAIDVSTGPSDAQRHVRRRIVDEDTYGNALSDLHEVPGRNLGGNETERALRCRSDSGDVSVNSTPLAGVDADLDVRPRADVRELRSL